MQSNIIATYKQRWSIRRNNLVADLIAGLTTAVSSIPDSMASALLAGINPLTGLYTMILATPIGAFFTSSEMMHISTTSALSLAVASSLVGVSPDMKLQAVFMLAFMVGVIQISLGLLKMGYLVRFVPFSVMTGFLNGVAILIILGQFSDFTGYSSPFSNRVIQAVDTALNFTKIVLPIFAVGLTTVILILLFNRNRKTKPYSLIFAMVIASTLAALPGFDLVPTVGDVTDVPGALPRFYLPDFSLLLSLVIPAFALSIIGLVQGAGISQGYPNPDGKFPDPSGDFFGQGVANLAASFFQGMPAGGSLSGTALVVNSGARSRWANVFVGILIAIIILLFSGLVELIAMPALAGLLIVIGFQTIKPTDILTVWQTGLVPRVVMLITFVGTLIMPLQFAVLLGVAVSIVLYISQQANRIKLVEIIPQKGGFPLERPAPAQLPSHKITMLYPYGSLFYAAAKTLEENLPAPEDTWKAVVIFLLRGYDEFGSTMIGVLDRYTRTVQDHGGKVMLVGLSEGVLSQLERTGLLELIGKENIFLAQEEFGIAANQAFESAQKWLEVVERQEIPAENKS
jgi:sulfate permease, SulP family